MKVLVVDDEKMGRESLRSLLSICDFDVVTASNGAEAVALAKTTQLDIAIIDWMLGSQADGLAVANEVRELQPEIRVVIVSGHLESRFRDVQKTRYEFLTKPFQLDELLNLIGL